jgi:hypothetical protein
MCCATWKKKKRRSHKSPKQFIPGEKMGAVRIGAVPFFAYCDLEQNDTDFHRCVVPVEAAA